MSFDSRKYWVFLSFSKLELYHYIIYLYIYYILYTIYYILIFSSKGHQNQHLQSCAPLTWCCWSCHWWVWSPRPGSPPWYARRSSAEQWQCWAFCPWESPGEHQNSWYNDDKWVWVNTYRYITIVGYSHPFIYQLWLGVHKRYQGFDPSPKSWMFTQKPTTDGTSNIE